MSQHKKSLRQADRTGPRQLALFQKRIEGDDALLELARLRFQQAGLGVECYGGSMEELDWLLDFRPWPEAPTVAHLNREINLLSREGCEQFLQFASTFGGRVSGFVVHDRAEFASRPDSFQTALAEINTALKNMEPRPFLFVEYAAGIPPHEFCSLIESIKELDQVSACLDTGHLGIWQVRQAYQAKHPGEDICALTPTDPLLPELVDDLQEAVASVPAVVADVVRRLGKLAKPLHFHLHDGHPLSTLSHFGVSDHLSFFEQIAIPFPCQGNKTLAPMFGPHGLKQIVAEACAALTPELLTFSLEIHPTTGRLALGDASELFTHWTDTTNAEQMNQWLAVLLDNHRLLSRLCREYCG